MRKLQYRKINELLDTLQEAINILLTMQDDRSKVSLISDSLFFINEIEKYIAEISGAEEVLAALRHLRDGEGGMLFAGSQQEWPEMINAIREKLEMVEIEHTEPEEFQRETDFSRYLDLLYKASEDGYSIFITSMDTPCGSPEFTPELGEKLRGLGLSVNLFYRWRVSYCAVIDEGMKVDEKISDTHSVSISCRLGNSEIILKSVGMQKADAARNCSVMINGQEKAVRHRGLSFIIYDKEAEKVIDSVNFDMFTNDLAARRANASLALKEFINKTPQVVFMNVQYPPFPKENLSQYEKRILNEGIHYSRFYQDPMFPSPMHQHIKEASGVLEVLRPPVSYIGTDGARHFENREGKYFNTVNGHR